MNETHVQNATRQAQRQGGELIAIKKMSGDDFLYIVLVHKITEYVVWYYNANDNAFSNGSYHFDLIASYEALNRRHR